MATEIKKKKRDPERTNGKAKVKRAPTLPDVGEYDFRSEENNEAAISYMKHLHVLYSDEPGFQALLKFAEWSRDTIGWRSFGRVVTKGTVER